MTCKRRFLVWASFVVGALLLTAGCRCVDNDGDGYGSPGSALCSYPVADCDDTNPKVNPGVQEGPLGDPTCADGLDNDCDGLVDGDDAGCGNSSGWGSMVWGEGSWGQ